MAKTQASQALTPQDRSQDRSQDRFFSLLKRDILKLDLAELDFGIYRILNYRRAQVLAYRADAAGGYTNPPGNPVAGSQTHARGVVSACLAFYAATRFAAIVGNARRSSALAGVGASIGTVGQPAHGYR